MKQFPRGDECRVPLVGGPIEDREQLDVLFTHNSNPEQ